MAYQAGNALRTNDQRMPLNINTNQLDFESHSQRGDNKRYSWEDSPVEMQNPGRDAFHQTSHPDDTYTSREQTTWPAAQVQAQTQQQDTPQQQRSLVQPQGIRQESQPTIPRSGSPYNIPSPAQPHPVLFAPVVHPDTNPSNVATYLYQGPYTPSSSTPSQLPQALLSSDQKPPIHQGQEAVTKMTPLRQDTQIFSPSSLSSPNAAQPSSAPHNPGQITHPNMDMRSPGSKALWQHQLCECSSDMSTCLLGFTCPCILSSRTSYRINAKDKHHDPTDLLGFENVNTRCLLFAGTMFCCLHCTFVHPRLFCSD